METPDHDDLVETNWSRAFDYMNAIPEARVRSMLRLVYERFVLDGLNGPEPPADFDLEYCFQLLARAFADEEAVANACAGKYCE